LQFPIIKPFLFLFTDTLAALARNIGEETFKPLAGDSIQLGLQLITSTDDPDIRKSSYGLFASVSSILKEGMSPCLPPIIDFIMKSIQNKDGFLVSPYFLFIHTTVYFEE
jgi:hypothetical protein